jgi:hypothetical protein
VAIIWKLRVNIFVTVHGNTGSRKLVPGEYKYANSMMGLGLEEMRNVE